MNFRLVRELKDKGLMMKLFSSLIVGLAFSTTVHSSIIRIHFTSNKLVAQKVKNYFITEYKIPKSLIITLEGSCTRMDERKYLDLCINEKGELLKLSSHIDFQIKSLSIFKQPI